MTQKKRCGYAKPGLYEQVINDKISRELAEIPAVWQETAPIDTAEASQVDLVNQVIGVVRNATQEADFAALSVDQRAEQLLALLKENDARLALGKTAADITARRHLPPKATSLRGLFTNRRCSPSSKKKSGRRTGRYAGILY